MKRYFDADALLKELERQEDLADDWYTAHEMYNVVKYFPTTDDVTEKNDGNIEPLTDKEQRIFLAAMGREEKVCKKADEEYYGIDNINLVRVCREIERKVKKALWE